MAPPSYALSTPHWKNEDLFPKLPKLFPPPILPPPAPPLLPPFVYHNLTNTGFAWPILPRIPRAQHSCRPKKIINICDPQTGQDVTEEILSSVGNDNIAKKNTLRKVPPPIRQHNLRRNVAAGPIPIPLGFVRKCNQDPDYFWPEAGRRWDEISPPFLGSRSWPPSTSSEENDVNGFSIPPRKRYQSLTGNNKNVVKYSRDVLLSLRYYPLAMSKPDGLPNLDIFKKDIQLREKMDRVCHNGTQTTMAKSVRSLDDKSRETGASLPKSKPKPKSRAKPKYSSSKQETCFANGNPMNENDMSLINLKEEISQKLTSLFL